MIDFGEPLVTTNAWCDDRFSAEDSIVGHNLRSIACVPLRVREDVIGAMYLESWIRAWVSSHRGMLVITTFANEAVSIWNARVCTRTDQALSARVDELTMRQQIDRQLNTSLDLERVLDLTLS
jgi:GAF domain-containing protein